MGATWSERALPRRSERETEDVAKGVMRMIRAVGNRVADQDVDGLPYLVMLADEVDRQMRSAVTRLHDDCGYSWSEIGARLGISKQAAQQRFGHPLPGRTGLHLVAGSPSTEP